MPGVDGGGAPEAAGPLYKAREWTGLLVEASGMSIRQAASLRPYSDLPDQLAAELKACRDAFGSDLRAIGCEVKTAIGNYAALLKEIWRSPQEVDAQLNTVTAPLE